MKEEPLDTTYLMSAGVAYLAGTLEAGYALLALKGGAQNWMLIAWHLALAAGVFACANWIQKESRAASAGLVIYLVYLIVFCMMNPTGNLGMLISFAALLFLLPAVRGLQLSRAQYTGGGGDEIDF